MSKPLKPGDRCYYVNENGLKLRGTVCDYLMMPVIKQSGSEALVPFKRVIGKVVLWLRRGDLRKLPDIKDQYGKVKQPKPRKPSLMRLFVAKMDRMVKAKEITMVEAKTLIEQARKRKWREAPAPEVAKKGGEA